MVIGHRLKNPGIISVQNFKILYKFEKKIEFALCYAIFHIV